MSTGGDDVLSEAQAAGLRLGYHRLAIRRDIARFPQLATQVRCSTGFTHAPSGRLEVASAPSGERRDGKGRR